MAQTIQPEPSFEIEKLEIARLLRRIRPSSPIVPLANSIISGRKEPPESIDAEVAALTHSGKFRWRERRVAAWSLGWTNLAKKQSELSETILTHVIRNGLPIGVERVVRPVICSMAVSILT